MTLTDKSALQLENSLLEDRHYLTHDTKQAKRLKSRKIRPDRKWASGIGHNNGG